MLMLTRRLGEDIVIECPDGTRITIRLADVRQSLVRFGIEAPMEYRIYRAELLERKEQR